MSNQENHIAYQEVRDGPSIYTTPGIVKIPEEIPSLTVDQLSEEMQLVINTALALYNRWLISAVVIEDDRPRYLLTFKANIPQGAATLRLNLGKLSTEVANGLSVDMLKQALNFLE
jgi:hypothetical protein